MYALRLFALVAMVGYGVSLHATDSLTIALVEDWTLEVERLTEQHVAIEAALRHDLQAVSAQLDALPLDTEADLRQYIRVQRQRDRLREQLAITIEKNELQRISLRYSKGIDIIRLLYEKMLSLDYHFASANTYQNLNDLSNPASYAEYRRNRNMILDKLNKKQGVKLPPVLESNLYVSAAHTLINAAMSMKGKRSEELTEIACIIDFTLRMHGDLKTIYFEIGYLQQVNTDLKTLAEQLFVDYAAVVAYNKSLDDCREADDWGVLDEARRTYTHEALEALESGDAEQYKINMQFALDRVRTFIDDYVRFISQCNEYYRKFDTIVNNYENEERCTNDLSDQYTTLKRDIKKTLDRFNNAYDLAELRGTKLKVLLYGRL